MVSLVDLKGEIVALMVQRIIQAVLTLCLYTWLQER